MQKAEHPDEDSRMREHKNKGTSEEEASLDNVPAKGIIHMIVGGFADGDSGRARRAHARAARIVMEIDNKAPAGGPMTHFDSGSSADVLFYRVYQEIELGDVPLEPVNTSPYGFAGEVVHPLEQISLPLPWGPSQPGRTRMAHFLVVDMPSTYNLILGRHALNTFQAVVSTYHMKLKFPVGDSVGKVKCDQHTSQKCYVEAIKSSSNKMEVDLPNKESNKNFSRQEDQRGAVPTGVQLAEELLSIQLNADVFAWIASDLIGINPSITVHSLNVDPTFPPIKQKKRHFKAENNDKIIQEEVYHQIMLNPDDQKRVDFITSGEIYCYVVMSFGLKNVGATYQRLVDRMFREKLGRNMEVYVDDMLVKSKQTDQYLVDLVEIFDTLRKFHMKLNPTKCAFGVRSGKFLGYMVTEKGVEVNSEKIRAIKEMKPPANLNEDEDCQQVFQDLKAYPAQLHLLTKPTLGETLYIYLAASQQVVSSVLIKEKEGLQKLIYDVRKASGPYGYSPSVYRLPSPGLGLGHGIGRFPSWTRHLCLFLETVLCELLDIGTSYPIRATTVATASPSTTHLQAHRRYLCHVMTGDGSSSWNSPSSLHTPTAPDKAYDDHIRDTVISRTNPGYSHRVHVTTVIPQVQGLLPYYRSGTRVIPISLQGFHMTIPASQFSRVDT
ncbi:UNVERIFIED_CONTAM: Retrovirus-related Pol polyprotein from transposon opus [Sesamum latifolium]|uniref:Retrovirus-related Pol polyprotein from transposon opus n=1 Tax=Sesamum latifolium TaxID=2727402 RepID=A0AAW2WX27_9LAMI